MAEEAAHIDIESFSEADIKKVGGYRYAEDLSTFIWCLGFRFGPGPKHIWLLPIGGEWPTELVDRIEALVNGWGGAVYTGWAVPQPLLDWIAAGKKLAAHNAGFERTMLNGAPGQAVEFPRTPIKQWKCTAAKSRASGLPGALAGVCKALGTHNKNDAGRGVMLQLCRPRKPSKDNPDTVHRPALYPDKFYELIVYNLDDVEAEAQVDDALPDLSPNEQRVWELDQLINDRGVTVDEAFVHDAQFLVEEYRAEIAERCVALAGCKPTQRERVADWIRANGWPHLTDMQAETVGHLLENSDVPKDVKTVLKMYGTYGMKAVSKFQPMLDAACADGRVRGMFVYYGAGTGRWSSILIQLQNMFRPVIEDMLVAVDAISARSLPWLKTLYAGVADAMKVLASTCRAALVAGEGKDLVSVDFAGIESRVTAWMAGEEWELEAFRKQDAEGGPDNYMIAYADTFGGEASAVTKPQRQKGKPIALFNGFEGGVGAFVTMAKTYRVKISDMVEAVWARIPEHIMRGAMKLWERRGQMSGLDRRTYVALDSIKRMWRERHPATQQLWRDLKDAAILAVENPGQVHSVPNKKIMFKAEEYKGRQWLRMRLPSGRRLSYYQPRIEWDMKACPTCQWRACEAPDCKTAFICSACDGEGRIRVRAKGGCNACGGTGKVKDDFSVRVTYMGIDTKTRQWTRVSSYGGKWTENAVQAASRDLLVNGMFAVEARGWPIVMTVHDEVVLEVDTGTVSVEDAEQVLCVLPRWAEGLPVAAEGWCGYRYRK